MTKRNETQKRMKQYLSADGWKVFSNMPSEKQSAVIRAFRAWEHRI
jgi:hypothetical protein